ncbi:MAG: PepSY domain-containing protein [Methylophagaceae bacterium]
MSISSAWAEDTIQLPLTKQTAAEIIQLESSGKILSVDKDEADKKVIFLIKVLHDDGKIKIYKLDASTGLPPE